MLLHSGCGIGHNLILIYTRKLKKKSENHFGCQEERHFKMHPEIFAWTDQKHRK